MNMNLTWPQSVLQDAQTTAWLEQQLFPEFFDHTVFEASASLFRFQIEDSLLEDALYRGVPQTGFQKAQLNDAVNQAAIRTCGTSDALWFHVNIHDNLVRQVERFGRYDFDWPLVPIYIMLIYQQAAEGGTTYAGLLGADRSWVLLFADQTSISVHGKPSFVNDVCQTLNMETD